MGINIANNFTLGVKKPVDDRMVVQTKADLSSLLAYDGLETLVLSEKIKYRYLNGEWKEITATTTQIADNSVVTTTKIDETTGETIVEKIELSDYIQSFIDDSHQSENTIMTSEEAKGLTDNLGFNDI